MKEKLQKIENHWLWKWLKKNSAPIIIILMALGLIVSLCLPFLSNKTNEETYISKRPDVKIKSVYLKTNYYQEYNGPMSYALKFFIPIRNEGDTTAYNVEIKRKDLELVEGVYTLTNPSLQTIYTNSPFDLKPRELIEDTIFIDEAPAYMQKVMSGEESISLKYEIRFYADGKSKCEPFVYQYEIKFTKGQFQNDSVRENLNHEIKP